MLNEKQAKTWKEVIENFLRSKKNAEEESYLKEIIKKAAKNFELESSKSFFDPKKNKKNSEQSSIDFQREKFQKIPLLEEKPQFFNFGAINSEYENKCLEISTKFSAGKWIEDASKNASSISFATHVVKLTHSKIDTPSFLDSSSHMKTNVLSTSSLKEKVVDGAVSGNQFAPVFQFLELECNGKKLATVFSDKNNQVLSNFTEDYPQLRKWNKGFQKALFSDSLSSHFLLKQIFFPIKNQVYDTVQYHLLNNIQSSSLAQAIHDRLFDKSLKKHRELKKKEKYSNNNTIYFPDKSSLGITASNHSNASQLNGKRGGKIQLFSCQPPNWESQLKAPINRKSLFDSLFKFNKKIKEEITYLRDFLLRFKTIDLSIQNPKRRKWIDQWLKNIISSIFDYVAEIHTLSSGWSSNEKIKLKRSHQLFLDPYRNDIAFQAERKNNVWQVEFCEDFAFWLNKKLIGVDKKFTSKKEHRKMWIQLMEVELREFNEILELENNKETEVIL